MIRDINKREVLEMDEYISREEALSVIANMQVEHHYDSANLEDRYVVAHLLEVGVKIKDLKTADVQPVVETEDLATATEQFICKNCGIRIENFDKVVLEEDNDGYIEKLFYEYIFKFCPECGAKVKED